MRSILFALALLAGCTVGTSTTGQGGTSGGGVDASTQGTGSGSGSSNGNNNGSGSGSGSGSGTCTGALYDPCTTASQCMSGKCQAFAQAGIEVCTQTCTPGDNTTCPTQNGQPATCNNMGICKPPAANSCTR